MQHVSEDLVKSLLMVTKKNEFCISLAMIAWRMLHVMHLRMKRLNVSQV